jgi:hypothetical protein
MLYEAVEHKLVQAKALQFNFQVDFKQAGAPGACRGTWIMGEGNRFKGTFELQSGTQGLKAFTVSDSKTVLTQAKVGGRPYTKSVVVTAKLGEALAPPMRFPTTVDAGGRSTRLREAQCESSSRRTDPRHPKSRRSAGMAPGDSHSGSQALLHSTGKGKPRQFYLRRRSVTARTPWPCGNRGESGTPCPRRRARARRVAGIAAALAARGPLGGGLGGVGWVGGGRQGRVGGARPTCQKGLIAPSGERPALANQWRKPRRTMERVSPA